MHANKSIRMEPANALQRCKPYDSEEEEEDRRRRRREIKEEEEVNPKIEEVDLKIEEGDQGRSRDQKIEEDRD